MNSNELKAAAKAAIVAWLNAKGTTITRWCEALGDDSVDDDDIKGDFADVVLGVIPEDIDVALLSTYRDDRHGSVDKLIFRTEAEQHERARELAWLDAIEDAEDELEQEAKA